MKIEVKPNKNIFYLFAILNLIGYDDDNGKPFHLLRTKARKDLAGFKNNSSLKNLKKILEN